VNADKLHPTRVPEELIPGRLLVDRRAPDQAPDPSKRRRGEAELPFRIRLLGLIVCLQIVAGGLALRQNEIQRALADPAQRSVVPAGSGEPAQLSPSDAAASAQPTPTPRPSPVAFSEPAEPVGLAPAPVPPADGLVAYRGLGAWVDHYDYGRPGTLPPAAILDELVRRGVRTLYLQTGRWASTGDIDNPEAMGAFVDLAHQRGIKVIGWYLPGFGDLDRDIRRSLAVLSFRSPSGGAFDSFAPDIEDATAVGNDRGRFNAGIAEYSRRLRASVPQGTVLGAIVPDAKNNERARGGWAGFPWPEIGRSYDVILPMAYWSVTKDPAACRTIQMDAAGYIKDVVSKTNTQMGIERPMHPIGGIADCNTAEEIAAYAGGLRDTSSIGGSLYDFVTNDDSPLRDALWGALESVNGLIPAPQIPALPAGAAQS
jgi:hypothetical protein